MNYIVKSGDTLYKIAKQFNLSLQVILSVNPQIHNPNVIAIGQRITIPEVGGGKLPNGGEGANEPGTPGQKFLRFISAALLNGTNIQGAVNIPINPDIVLTFDKNVVNNTVWSNNQGSITLADAAGKNISIRVTKMSDKVDFTQRQKIYVQPVNGLASRTEYILRISPALKAINGRTLGETTGGQYVSVSFRTQ